METPKLREHLVLKVENPIGQRDQLVYAPTEYKRITPYAFSWVRFFLYWFLVLCTGGILLIVTVWFPHLYTYIARSRLPLSSLGRAQYLLVKIDEEEGWRAKLIEVIVHHTLPPLEEGDSRQKLPWVWFEFKKNRYTFNHEKQEFERFLSTIKEELANVQDRKDFGLNEVTITSRLKLFGANLVDLEPTPIYQLLFVKIVHPFYLFQVFSAVVWFIQAYTIYAITILVLSGVSMFWEIYSEVVNVKRLRSLVRSNRQVQVIRTLSTRSTNENDPMITKNKKIDSTTSDTPLMMMMTMTTTTTNSATAGLDENTIILQEESPNPRNIHTIHEQKLVPGDIIVIKEGIVVADILLLTGDCVVDESNLTGEAIPINKRAITKERGEFTKDRRQELTEHFARTECKESFLHAGSTVTRLRASTTPCRGVVLSTGFSTGKGELFRSIIFPKQITFEFERDSYRYLAMLVTIAICAFIKRVVEGQAAGTPIEDVIVKSLDLITVAVPPALPLVLSAGVGIAQKKLIDMGIYCIESTRINCSGQLSMFCFDKTGTLTEDHLNLKGVDTVTNDGKQFRFGGGVQENIKQLPKMLQVALATCHGLSETDGKLIGYSLELDMFQSTGYILKTLHDHKEDAHNYSATVTSPEGETYGILKKFPFDAVYQRSSVIIEDISTKKQFFFVKGSPEAIQKVAVGSTIPSDFDKQALVYSSQGYYCIAFGMREVSIGTEVDGLKRNDVEKDISFMGLSLFINQVKPQSKGMIHELYEANIDVRVITGDNALTAVHVARELAFQLQENVAIVKVDDGDMLYHPVNDILRGEANNWQPFTGANMSRILSEFDLAITGEALEMVRQECGEESLRQVLVNTKIYARVRPQQKAWIVDKFMEMGHIVGMTGDGTNDCGALKAAHVGLALSSADASIVAPFTSKKKEILDVITLIREGRCALTTSFLGFKYMVLYPIIQLAMASTLAHTEISLSNNQYMWDDLAIVLGLSLTMLYTNASTKLTKERPAGTLFSMSIVSSLLGQISLFIAFFAGGYAFLHGKEWFCSQAKGVEFLAGNNTIPACKAYEKIPQYEDDIFDSYENSVVWLYGHMFYFSVAAAFNIKDAFRQAFYTNWLFTGLFIASFGVNLWFLLDTSGTINATFQTVALPSTFRFELFGLFVANLILSIGWEFTSRRLFPVFFRQTTMDKYAKAHPKKN